MINVKRVTLVICAVLAFFLLAVGAKVFLIGNVKSVDTVIIQDLQITDNEISFHVLSVTSADVISHFSYRIEDETLFLSFRSVLAGGLNIGNCFTIQADCSAVTRIVLEDQNHTREIWAADELNID